jgi:hypothetical protein
VENGVIFANADYRRCANRSFYTAYQMETSIYLKHRDEGAFPHGWNNPSQEQLPDLIRNKIIISDGKWQETSKS